MKTLDDDKLEELRTSGHPITSIKDKGKKWITNGVNYDILQSKIYTEKFGYLSIEQRQNDLDYEETDMIDKLLHVEKFHYLKKPESKSMMFRLSKRLIKDVKARMKTDSRHIMNMISKQHQQKVVKKDIERKKSVLLSGSQMGLLDIARLG